MEKSNNLGRIAEIMQDYEDNYLRGGIQLAERIQLNSKKTLQEVFNFTTDL